MRLRTFIAASMAEAIEQVRRELGPDAIIVSDYANEAGGVEVTAAIETMRPGPAAQAPRPSRLPDIEASLEQLLRGRLREIPRDIAPDMNRGAASDARGHAHASAAPFSGASPSGIPFDETLIARALGVAAVTACRASCATRSSPPPPHSMAMMPSSPSPPRSKRASASSPCPFFPRRPSC